MKGIASPPLLIALNDSADPETILSVIHAGADEYLYPPMSDNLGKALDRAVASRTSSGRALPAAAARCSASFPPKAAAALPPSPATRRSNWPARAPRRSCSPTSTWTRDWWAS